MVLRGCVIVLFTTVALRTSIGESSPFRHRLLHQLSSLPESDQRTINEFVAAKFGGEELVFDADVPIDFGDIDENPGVERGWKLRRGRQLYVQNCQQCHGQLGDGNGRDAARLSSPPRDFQTSEFRWKEVLFTQPPTRHDIAETLRIGVPGTAMQPTSVSEADRLLIAEYTRWLAIRGEVWRRSIQGVIGNNDGTSVQEECEYAFDAACKKWGNPDLNKTSISTDRASSAESIARGRQLFVLKKCTNCHGVDGRGDGEQTKIVHRDTFGMSNPRPGLFDGDGRHILPRNLVTDPLKGGNSKRDIYGRIVNGIGFSKMPYFHSVLNPDEVWDVVDYVESIRENPLQKQARVPQPMAKKH